MATVVPSRQRVFADAFALEMKRRRMIATVALVILLEQAMVGVSPLTLWEMTEADAQGDVFRQVIILATLGVQLLVPANARPPMAVPTSILILLGYCLLSCIWAIEPTIALRRLTLTVAVIWILVRAIGDLGAVRTLNVVRAVLVALLVINYLAVAFLEIGTHLDLGELNGDWRGVLPHKNIAGAISALTILLFAFDRPRIADWLQGLVIAASVFFLLMTQSKTSIAMVAIAFAAGTAMRFYNPRHRSILLPVGLVGVMLLLGFLAMYSGVIEDSLADPELLTGRGQVWQFLLDYTSDHMWTGAGYESFWQIGRQSPIWSLTTDWVARTSGHGHNGYLDILATIGIPGLVLTILVLFVWPTIRLLCSLSIGRSRRALFCAILVFCAGHNMTESTLLDRLATVHVAMMIVVILIHRLSDQSAGAHQRLRDRMIGLGSREGLADLRKRLVGRTRIPKVRTAWRGRPPKPVEPNTGDGIA